MAAKAPKPRSEQEPRLLIKLDDSEWPFDPRECTPKDARDLRKATGATLPQIMSALGSDNFDIDYAAGLVMLARRQHEGGWVSFDHVTITYNSRFEVGVEESDDPAEDADTPEA